ncbi:MAG TPA: hypothetical protein VIY47_14710, partial [Ignavibacteriaceae bacterium]
LYQAGSDTKFQFLTYFSSMPPKQKSLIAKFLVSTILFGVVFMVIHFLIPPDPETNLFQHYTVYVITGSVLVYLLQFRKNIREADFQGDGKYYLPLAFFVGMIFTPVGFIYMAEPVTNASDFLIFIGIFWSVYIIIGLVFWLMVKTGNQDWTTDDDDRPSLQ